MKKSRKIMLSCLVLAVIATFTVSPTFSWLSASSDVVVNTFAGGGISITIDESPTDENGEKTDGDRVTENAYKYTAGSVLDKDPTVTVLADSEECYVYLCVKNQLPEEYFTIDYNIAYWEEIATYEADNDTVWTVYRYKSVVAQSGEDQALEPIFTTVTVSSELTQEQIEALGTKTATVQAYAVQTASVEQEDADTMALAFFGLPVESTIEDADVEAESVEDTETEDQEDTETQTDDSSETTESDDSSAASEADDSSAATEGDDSSAATEADDSSAATEGNDSSTATEAADNSSENTANEAGNSSGEDTGTEDAASDDDAAESSDDAATSGDNTAEEDVTASDATSGEKE